MMRRYDLAKLAGKRAKGVTVRLGAIHARPGTVRAYERALFGMLRDLLANVRDDLLPLYNPEPMVRDAAPSEGAFERFRALAGALVRTVNATVGRILELEKVRHTATFMQQAKRTLGVDLSSVIDNEDLREFMEAANQRNASLIRSVAEQVASRVEQTILKNTMEGNSVNTLRKELQEQFDLSRSRAQLIARDQTAKFNSDLNRIRQEQAGVEAYEWLTSADERVRPLHRGLNGKEYRWGQTTGAEGGAAPGQPIRCRCVAIGLVRF